MSQALSLAAIAEDVASDPAAARHFLDDAEAITSGPDDKAAVIEVAQRVAEDLSNKHIAARLPIAEPTVASQHVRNIITSSGSTHANRSRVGSQITLQLELPG